MSRSFVKDMTVLSAIANSYISGKVRKADAQQELDSLLLEMGYLKGYRNTSCYKHQRCCGMRGMCDYSPTAE